MLRTIALGTVAAGATGTAVGIRDLKNSYVTIAGTFSATWYVEVSLDETNYATFDSGTAAKWVGPLPLGCKARLRVGAGTGSVIGVIGGDDTGAGSVRATSIGPVAAGATGAAFAISYLDKCQAVVGGTFSGTWTLEGSFDGGTTWKQFDTGTAAKWIGPLPRCTHIRASLGSGTGSIAVSVAGLHYEVSNVQSGPPGSVRAGNITAQTSSGSGTLVSAKSLQSSQVYVSSTDFVGTYYIDVTFDGGTTYAPAASAVVGSGTTYTTHTLPRVDGFRLRSTLTSGTLNASWSGSEDRRG